MDAASRALRPYWIGLLTPMLTSEVSSMFSRILFAIDDDEALPAAVPVVAGC